MRRLRQEQLLMKTIPKHLKTTPLEERQPKIFPNHSIVSDDERPK